ncbi:MAG TPA: glycosyltransferase [Deltaproteobacteria bacterium]|nr:glycosyltransferase [Deltaproteobacteria bacterium]
MNTRSQDTPLVSVLLTVHNGRSFIHDSVGSIMNQTFPGWELIIIDDGSTDGTSDILDAITDPRIHVHHYPRIGRTPALNIAAGLSRGEFLAIQDVDDISYPTRLEKQLAVLRKHPQVVLVASDADVIDSQERLLYCWKAPSDGNEARISFSRLSSPYVHGSLMFRKNAFIVAGRYDERFVTTQDFDLITRLFSCGDFYAIPESLYVYRVHPKSITGMRWIHQIRSTIWIRTTLTKKIGMQIRFSRVLILILKRTVLMSMLSLFPDLSHYLYRVRSRFMTGKSDTGH